IDNEPDFNPPHVYAKTGLLENQHKIENELTAGTYYWRVRAIDNAGNAGDWSTTWRLLLGIVRGVEITITPSENSGAPGTTLAFTVIVKNVGNIKDNYSMTVSENINWGARLTENRFDNVQPGENRTTTLRVKIPENAAHCTRDNITVVVVSRENEAVRDNASCTAHAVVIRKVEVVISPSSNIGAPGATLSYTVSVKNLGNVQDNYGLIISDTLGWGPNISPTSLSIPAGENRTATLSVKIPSGAAHSSINKITVTAISQTDNTVSSKSSCEAHVTTARKVELSVSPSYRSGLPGTTLTFTVTVRNAGQVDDNYMLSATSAAGWLTRIEPKLLALAAGASATATLSVTVPQGVAGGTSVTVYIKAVSSADSAVSDSASCRVIAMQAETAEVVRKIPLGPLALSAVLIIVAILAIKFFPRRERRPRFILRERRAAKRGVLREVAWGSAKRRGST
ncbi:MAG: hypothetical protein NZ934_01460, partial [Hadesarchaea archaeon]|nr:hypothetical protein [Hadesarchaea archaeon]